MELHPLCVIVLLTGLIHCTQTASPKPVVKVQATDPVFVGETVTLSCEIQTEGSWQYRWFMDTKELSDALGKETYTIFYVKESSKGAYTCSVTQSSDPNYTETSDAVTLNISENPKPELTSNLTGDVLTGNSVTLFCRFRPQSAGWKFYWITPTQSTETETETFSYTIRSVYDTGPYKCRAGRGNPVYYYTYYSNALRINVIESPKPTLTIQPDTQVFRGEKVTFRCDIQEGRDTEWTYDWFRDKKEFSPSYRTQEFSISSVTDSDRREYTCRGRRISDSQISKMSDPVTLTVSEKPKAEITSDLKGAALTGTSVTLTCKLKLQSSGWKFYWIKSTQRTEIGTETHHFFISSVRVSDGGQYMCRAGRGNPVYHTDYSDALWVNVTAESPPASLIINPSRTQHFTTDSLSLSCEDQSDSTGWTVRGYTHSEALFNCSSVSGATCNISSLSTSHTGVYWCQSESGGRSNSINITVHNGDVILDSPVQPVTEQHHLILRCLNRSKLPDTGVDFYTNNSIIQSQTTGEMTISRVSKSDEGFYHCKHPQKGESSKNWVSVRVSASGPTGVIIGLSLTSVFVILMILVILLLRYKKKKGVQSPTVNQDTNQPADDAAQGPNDALSSQIEMRNCKLQSKDAEANDVNYAEINLKKLKKPQKPPKPPRKPEKSSVGAETVYSELKQNREEGDFTATADATYAQIRMKGKKDNAEDITKIADVTYAQVKRKGKRDNAGP